MGAEDFAARGPKWFSRIEKEVQKGFVGLKEPGPHQFFKFVLTAILAGGHIVVSDVPGSGKTYILKAIARSFEAAFSRLQGQIDLLPADITGSVDPTAVLFEKIARLLGKFDPELMAKTQVQWGPVNPYVDMVLADEINRLSPKAQSALLEPMEELQLSIGGATYPMSEMFFVCATQNPVEEGENTPLTGAKADRFMFKMKLGDLSRESEIEFVFRAHEFMSHKALQDITAVTSKAEVLRLRDDIQKNVSLAPALAAYIVDVVRETREPSFRAVEFQVKTPDGIMTKEQPMADPETGISVVKLGASRRGMRDLTVASKVLAWFNGRQYVLPSDIKEAAVPTLSHRIVLDEEFQVIMRRSNLAEAIAEKAADTAPCPKDESVTLS